ncbi:hypothetical protein [Terrisporobacter glycolicus]|uniref:YcxB-like protein domain-containing protein n=1 Tax=Terrisporobacter glycolicus ATCC 14880 = DSM 1288 TaxID=1121315 RepID=A0ABZ2EU02_9FIRM|nr:hypothetical protein [Terrisporobacter glycolicus]
MKYEYEFSFDDYVSYLKMNFKLMKGKSVIDKKLILRFALIYICISLILRLLELKLLCNIFIIAVGAVFIFSSIILSNRVLSTNPKIFAKIMAKKNPEIIYAKRTLEIKDNQFLLHGASSVKVTNEKDIKDIMMDENIVGIISNENILCAYVPLSVFKDEDEKKDFIKVIKDMISEGNVSN